MSAVFCTEERDDEYDFSHPAPRMFDLAAEGRAHFSVDNDPLDQLSPLNVADLSDVGYISEAQFLARMDAKENPKACKERRKLALPRVCERMVGALIRIVREMMNMTDEHYDDLFKPEEPGSIVRAFDKYGCIVSDTLSHNLDSNLVMHNYVTSNGLVVIGPETKRNKVYRFSYADWANDRLNRVPIRRAVYAAECYSFFRPRGEQSGPCHLSELEPSSAIRLFKANRQTQSGAKDRNGQICSSLLLHNYIARKRGIIAYPFNSVCTNIQLVVNMGYTINLYKLATVYTSMTFVPSKILNVRLRLPGIKKCLLIVWGTGKCVCVGVTDRAMLDAALRFYYPYLRLAFVHKTDVMQGIEIQPDGTPLGTVNITKRRNRSGNVAKKRKHKNTASGRKKNELDRFDAEENQESRKKKK